MRGSGVGGGLESKMTVRHVESKGPKIEPGEEKSSKMITETGRWILLASFIIINI